MYFLLELFPDLICLICFNENLLDNVTLIQQEVVNLKALKIII